MPDEVIGVRSLIFAFSDDGQLAVHASLAEVQREYEGIDIEDGVVQFYASDGTPLVAHFTIPNRQGQLFGRLRWRASGHYDLVPDPDAARKPFADRLRAAQGLEPNPWYPSLAACRAALRPRREETGESAAGPPVGTAPR